MTRPRGQTIGDNLRVEFRQNIYGTLASLRVGCRTEQPGPVGIQSKEVLHVAIYTWFIKPGQLLVVQADTGCLDFRVFVTILTGKGTNSSTDPKSNPGGAI